MKSQELLEMWLKDNENRARILARAAEKGAAGITNDTPYRRAMQELARRHRRAADCYAEPAPNLEETP